MALVTNEHFPLKDEYWYILDFRKFLKPKLLPVYFNSKPRANLILKANVSVLSTRKKFTILKGRNIKDKIPYTLGQGNFFKYGGKYNYPTGLDWQQKKDFRTLMRRRLRRMGILTTVKPRHRYDKGQIIVKYKHNTQKVATSPNTDAKVFQLDRKPKKYYYVLIKKRLSKKAGIIFELRVIRYDVKTKETKKMWLNVQRSDIFVPYLYKQFKTILHDKGIPEKVL